jgi:bacteriocin biosynthesis cyclodehydratase domain-containing protein
MSQKTTFRLKRHLSVIPHSVDVVELRHGVWNPVSHTLTDESGSGILFGLLQGMDGSITSAELARKEGVPRSEVEALLDQLIELDLVEAGPSSALDAYLDHVFPALASPAPPETGGLRLTGTLEIIAEVARILGAGFPGGPVTMEDPQGPLMGLLETGDSEWLVDGIDFERRLGAFEEWRGGQLLVHATSVPHPVRLRALNRVALALELPWLHAAVDGPFLFVGPLFVPGRTACFDCFETRVGMNLRERASYQQYKSLLAERRVKVGAPPLEPALTSLLASHVALEALNFSATGNGFMVGKVLAVYLPSMEVSFNEVLRVPGCPSCGPTAERDAPELYFDLRALIGNGEVAP